MTGSRYHRFLNGTTWFANELKRRKVMLPFVLAGLPAPVVALVTYLREHSTSLPHLVALFYVWAGLTVLSWFFGYEDGRFVVWSPVVPGPSGALKIGIVLLIAVPTVGYSRWVMAPREVFLVLKSTPAEATRFENIFEQQLQQGLGTQGIVVKRGRDTVADAVLETNLHRQGDTITITAALRMRGQLKAQTPSRLSSPRVEGLDSLLQLLAQQVVEDVTPFLRRKTLKDVRLPIRTRSSPAYEALAVGMQALDAGDYNAAERSFQRALSFDPNLIEAHTRLGEVFLGRALSNYARSEAAFRAAEQHLSHGDSSAANYAARGMVALFRSWNLTRAKRLFDDALRKDGGLLEAQRGLGYVALARGDTRDAVARFRRAVDLSPGDRLRPVLDLGIAQYYDGHWSDARATFADVYDRAAAGGEEYDDLRHAAQVWGTLSAGRLGDTAFVRRSLYRFRPADQHAMLVVAQGFGILGLRPGALEVMDSMTKAFCPIDPSALVDRHCERTRPAYWTASYFAVMGAADSTLHWINLALDDCLRWNWNRGCEMETRFIQSDPAFRALRRDDRFQDLLARYDAPSR
jgi:tetratricopeptide (TPR) repeat protein